MTGSMYSKNHPRSFWHLEPDPAEDRWQDAILRAIAALELSESPAALESALNLTLGEAQFGSQRWQLSPARHFYYQIKPFLPRAIINFIQCLNARSAATNFPLGWPIEERYARFQGEIIRQLVFDLNVTSLIFRHFWPEGLRYAVILTHDIETHKGQAFAGVVADLEESKGFRSSFNFVPEGYVLDLGLIQDLLDRGFEVGIHGLKHDGKLYFSKRQYTKRAEKINYYLQEFNAVGFRSPLMQRNPEWLQDLQIEYDLSFFDTDPYMPMPGGCMSIWPFFIGHFVELPYTLAQDCTVCTILKETTPKIWLEKLAFIESYCGMALLNTHPDYLKDKKLWNMYATFLDALAEKDDFWHALPHEAADWWRERDATPNGQETADMIPGMIELQEDELVFRQAEFTSIDRATSRKMERVQS